MGFSGDTDGKESACSAGDLGSIPGLGRLEKGMATHSSTLAWRIYGQRSLVGYSPWGRKEPDTTEWLTHTANPVSLRCCLLPPAFCLSRVLDQRWGHGWNRVLKEAFKKSLCWICYNVAPVVYVLVFGYKACEILATPTRDRTLTPRLEGRFLTPGLLRSP